jgi:hypothetical protein
VKAQKPDVPTTVSGPKLDWLNAAVHQLDAVITEDPQQRSAGVLVMRALVRKALQGDVRAIKECFRLAEKAAEPTTESVSSSPPPAPKSKGGRPRAKIDLDQVRDLAREGMWSAAHIARVLKVLKQTLLSPANAADVKEAVEDGKALWALDHLRQFNAMVKTRRFDPAILYATKQSPIGWSDRQTIGGVDGGPVPIEIAGASARLVEAVMRLQRQRGNGDVGQE